MPNHSAWTAAIPVTPQNGSDTSAPQVSIAEPAHQAVVSGTITLRASASDNVGVVSVQFRLDGAKLIKDTVAPFETTLDTRTLRNGNHKLRAVARDAAGNATYSSTITVKVSN